MGQPLRDDPDQADGGDHADLHRVGADVAEYCVELLGEEFRSGFQDPGHAGGVLGGQGGDGGHGEHAVHGHRLDVCLDTGASAGIASGDR